MPVRVLVRGGGDLASGVALRLFRTGFQVLITELPRPLVVRRLVSFAEAIYQGEISIEGVRACQATDIDAAFEIISEGKIPVLIDPEARAREVFHPEVVVDARLTKRPPDLGMEIAPLVIGLGPGFIAGVNCHAAIETNRGHFLGRVIWEGAPEADTGKPDTVAGYGEDRVLRAPAAGIFHPRSAIGDSVDRGAVIAEVDGHEIRAPFKGVLRGLLHSGLSVHAGMKVGDLDPRDDPRYCTLVSDKSLAVGGGVLEAVLSRPEMRLRLR